MTITHFLVIYHRATRIDDFGRLIATRRQLFVQDPAGQHRPRPTSVLQATRPASTQKRLLKAVREQRGSDFHLCALLWAVQPEGSALADDLQDNWSIKGQVLWLHSALFELYLALLSSRILVRNRTGADRLLDAVNVRQGRARKCCEAKLIREQKSANFHLKLAFLMLNWSLIEARPTARYRHLVWPFICEFIEADGQPKCVRRQKATRIES